MRGPCRLGVAVATPVTQPATTVDTQAPQTPANTKPDLSGDAPHEWSGLDVAIVGGGPAGLATAAALLAVQPGLRVKVFEASPSYAATGAGVALFYNGAAALEALDPAVLHGVVPCGALLAGFLDYNDTSGQRMPWCLGWDRGADLAQHGYTPVHLQWGALRGALYDRLPEGIVEFGCKVTGVEVPKEEDGGAAGKGRDGEGEDGAERLFAVRMERRLGEGGGGRGRDSHGGPGPAAAAPSLLATARHVIAADGYFSRVRRTAGDHVIPITRRRRRWFGTLSTSELAAAGVALPPCMTAPDPSAPPSPPATPPPPSPPDTIATDSAPGSGVASSSSAGPVPGDGPLPASPWCVHRWMPVTPGSPILDVQRAPRGLAIYPVALREAEHGTGEGGQGPGDMQLVWSYYADEDVVESAGVSVDPSAGEQAGASGGSAAAAGGAAESVEGSATVHGGTRGGGALDRCLAVTAYLPAEVRALLAATPQERVSEYGMYMHGEEAMVEGAWARGRLLLLGDAAHAGPPDGQGANLALEDAVALGEAVRRHGLGPQAFAAWEAARLPRVTAMVLRRPPKPADFMALARSVAFAPLWSAEGMAAAAGGEGGLPAEVARAVLEAAAKGGQTAAEQVVLSWSRGVVRRQLEGKMAGRPLLSTVMPGAMKLP